MAKVYEIIPYLRKKLSDKPLQDASKILQQLSRYGLQEYKFQQRTFFQAACYHLKTKLDHIRYIMFLDNQNNQHKHYPM